MQRRLFLTSAALLVTSAAAAIAQTPPAASPPAASPAPAAPPPAAPAPSASTAPSAAPATPPLRVRGTIVSLSGNDLTVTSRDGETVEITLANPVTVSTVKRVKLASIGPNSFIGTTTRTGADGKLTAIEVHVFPEAMRGTGEGSHPWDLEPGSLMTNATVTGAVKSAKGREFTLSYKDASGSVKTSTVYVPPSTPVVMFAPASVADLKKGAKVFVIATKSPDGKLTAARVTVGTHGVAPPM